MKLEIKAISLNEAFARSAVAAFALPLEPTLTELSDIKTAVSEAVTNCVVHAYTQETDKEKAKILIECQTETLDEGGILHITVTDFGKGIENVERAILPFYTTLEDEERSGMGFTIMQTFMSDFSIQSKSGEGVKITMQKRIGAKRIESCLGMDGEGVDA
jgi:stage II sporulation protein AB (anti-sigma F factor)